jgi:hypothetical protein
MPFAAPLDIGLYANPSNLADVIRQVRDAFNESGDATPIMVGKRYIEWRGIGRAPKVLFVQTPGKLGPPIECGNAASITHGCTVYVHGSEDGDDIGRFDAAYQLGDKVIAAIRRAATGRLEFGAYNDVSPADVDGLGAMLSIAFTYQRDVRHFPGISGLPSATASTVTETPAGMQTGDVGTVETVDVEAEPPEDDE